MALLSTTFSPSEAKKLDFEPIPAGWYTAEIVKSSLKTTKSGEGKYIALTFKVTEGEFEGRFLFTNLNIVNKSDMAVRIAQSDLKAICEACNIDELEDTDELHNIPMGVKVTIKEETPQWPAKNELKAYEAAAPF